MELENIDTLSTYQIFKIFYDDKDKHQKFINKFSELKLALESLQIREYNNSAHDSINTFGKSLDNIKEKYIETMKQYHLFNNYVLLLSVYDFSDMNILPREVIICIGNVIINHNPEIFKDDNEMLQSIKDSLKQFIS
jgi:hypothetical protein